MRLINYYFDRLSYWLVYLYSFIFFNIIIGGLFLIFNNHLNADFSGIICVKMTLAMSALFSGVMTLTIWQCRDSQKFWDYAEAFEKQLLKSKTKDEALDAYNEHFEMLKSLSSGNIHYAEVRRLYSIYTTILSRAEII